MDYEKKFLTDFTKAGGTALTVFLIIMYPIGLLYLLFYKLPRRAALKKKMEQLKRQGILEQVIQDYYSVSNRVFLKGKIIFSNHYVFVKGGFILPYKDIVWVYREDTTIRYFFIPCGKTREIQLCTSAQNPAVSVPVPASAKDEIANVIREFYNRNNNCIVGYSQEHERYYYNTLHR